MIDAGDAIAARIMARAKKRRRPPSYREFSRTVSHPVGPLKGHAYNPDSDPCQAYVIDQMDANRWERFYLCTPPQLGGKTLIAVLVPALRNVIALRHPVGYGLPTLQDLDKAWAEKIRPALTNSGYGKHLPQAGPGARGGRGHTLQLSDPESGELEGMIVFLAGGAYGSTVAAAIVDEVDQFRTAEGSPQWGNLEDIFNRANAYGRKALRIAVGTIENDTQSIILPLVMEQGTGTRPWAKCPHCQHYQILRWDQVRYDPTDEESARSSARYACEHCAVAWTEPDRQTAVRAARFVHRGQSVDAHGEIVGDAPRTSAFGMLWTALDSVRGDLGEICVDHFRAKLQLDTHADHGPMRKFVRYKLCELYTAELEEMGAAADLTWRYLLDRSHRSGWGPSIPVTDRAEDRHPTYSRHLAEPPQDCIGCVAGVDVQQDRVYWVLTAFRADGSTFDCAWGYEYGREDRAPTSKAELHQLLDRTDIVLRGATGTLPLLTVGVDVGYETEAILAWLKGRPDWRATKGTQAGMKDEPGDIPGIVHRRDGMYLIAVDAVRELLHAAYRRPNGTPGAAHIPQGLSTSASDLAYLKHLCAERMVLDHKTKKFRLVKGPGRWDWQDARRIAEVMIRLQLKPKSRRPVLRPGSVGTVRF